VRERFNPFGNESAYQRATRVRDRLIDEAARRRRPAARAPRGPDPGGAQAFGAAGVAAAMIFFATRMPPLSIETLRRQITLATKLKCPVAEMIARVPAAIMRVQRGLKAGGIAAAGPAYTRYLRLDEGSGVFEIEVGVPVASAPRGYGDIYPSALPGGRVVLLWHEGPYERLGDSFARLFTLLAEEGLAPMGPAWESYAVGPDTERDSSRWRTAIVQPI